MVSIPFLSSHCSLGAVSVPGLCVI
jgi:hypothetical protein